MEAFLELVSKGVLNIRPLISHTFDIDQAEEAFDLVLGKRDEPSIGILLRYPENEGKKATLVKVSATAQKTDSIQVGFIGAGSFAQSYLIPNLKGVCTLRTVVTTKGITSKNVAQKFGFETASSASEDVFGDSSINTIFIATPHNSHASLAAQAMLSKKNVFVEKPLAITRGGLVEVTKAHKEAGMMLMVGFNRRFSPLAREIKKSVASGTSPVMMNFRVNAGPIAKDHWIQKPEVGGGRIVGEMCHFVDLMLYFSESLPENVFASSIRSRSEKEKDEDTLSVIINFRNGSIGNLTYVAVGDSSLPKERLEVFSAGKAAVIHDFKYGNIHAGNREHEIKGGGKGHREEVMAFVNALQGGSAAPIPFEELYATTETCFCIIDSLSTGLPQQVNVPF
jgi:polar amino acid transport system substrate-binding protein